MRAVFWLFCFLAVSILASVVLFLVRLKRRGLSNVDFTVKTSAKGFRKYALSVRVIEFYGQPYESNFLSMALTFSTGRRQVHQFLICDHRPLVSSRETLDVLCRGQTHFHV